MFSRNIIFFKNRTAKWLTLVFLIITLLFLSYLSQRKTIICEYTKVTTYSYNKRPGLDNIYNMTTTDWLEIKNKRTDAVVGVHALLSGSQSDVNASEVKPFNQQVERRPDYPSYKYTSTNCPIDKIEYLWTVPLVILFITSTIFYLRSITRIIIVKKG